MRGRRQTGVGADGRTLVALAHPAAVSQVLSAPVSLASSRSRGRLDVRAARVAGVEIPNQKRLETALTCVPKSADCHAASATPADRLPGRRYIYGIGPTTAKAILLETVRAGGAVPWPGCTSCGLTPEPCTEH